MEVNFTQTKNLTSNFGTKFAPLFLRLVMAGVFFWFGSNQILNSQGWVSYLPDFILKVPIDPTIFIFLNGTMEIVLGLFLVLGFFTRLSALVLGLHLLGIGATMGINPTAIRDIGLGLTCLAITMQGAGDFSLDNRIENKKLQGEHFYQWKLIAIMGLVALTLTATCFYVYRTKTQEAIKSSSKADWANFRGGTGSQKITEEMVKSHNSQNDCWLIISGKIYNVTQYISFHPGGSDRIIGQCGKDATTAFNTKGGTGGTHSANAQKLLAGYFIAELGQTISVSSNSISPIPNINKNTQTQTPNPPANNTQNQQVSNTNTQPASQNTSGITTAQVATHKTASDCWLIISGKVYNVTQYIPFHPGGENRITSNCGKDATTAFNTKGGTGGTHSANAQKLLAGYFVANISSGTNTNQTTSPTPTPTATTADKTPPSINITYPANGATVYGTIALQASASDSSGIFNVSFILDTNLIDIANSSPYSVSLNTTSFTNGQHTLKATATDKANNSQSTSIAITINNPTPTPQPTPTQQTSTTLTSSQVATHNSSSNCWLIIEGKVYDVTQYIPIHPGGQQRIISNCGTDATTAFNTKGGTGSTHSTNAHTILAGYFVGNLGSTVPTPTPTTNQTPTPTTTQNPTPTPTPTTAPTPTPTQTSGSGYTAAQVATHNTSSNCWLIISGNVYDVTQYIPVHPGGQQRIISNCGTDATTAFNTKGGTGSSHSNNAKSILAGFLIGTLNTSTTPTPTPTAGATPTPTTNPTPTPTSTGGATTYNVTINSSGVISPSSLTIKVGDTVKFTYTNPGDEQILTFSPQPPSNIKLDHDVTNKSYTFTSAKTYTYHPQNGGTNATIIVQ